MTGSHYKSLFKSPLWVRIVLDSGGYGQVQRLPAPRIAGNSPDRLLIEENPSLRHANRNHGNSSIEQLCFNECRDYLIQSCFQSCCIGVSMDEEHLESRLDREYDSHFSCQHRSTGSPRVPNAGKGQCRPDNFCCTTE